MNLSLAPPPNHFKINMYLNTVCVLTHLLDGSAMYVYTCTWNIKQSILCTFRFALGTNIDSTSMSSSFLFFVETSIYQVLPYCHIPAVAWEMCVFQLAYHPKNVWSRQILFWQYFLVYSLMGPSDGMAWNLCGRGLLNMHIQCATVRAFYT